MVATASFVDRKLIYLLSILIRIALLLYGEWQDTHMEVKFTDVDYFVFTDAAEFVSQRESPYRRATYRYSPILAWLLVPNIFLHKAWGKILFVAFDMCTAVIMERIMKVLNCDISLTNVAIAIWLFNPITMTISCRGNAESILSTLVVALLYAVVRKKAITAGCIFSIAAHLKIYPVIYSLCILCLFCKLDLESSNKKHVWLRAILPVSFFVKEKLRLKFVMSTVVSFFALLLLFYEMYGQEFLEHTFLYHVSRRDVRHNFSVYFYMMYLHPSQLLNFFGFVSQVLILITVSFTMFHDPPFCFFLSTVGFVAFNKVCTSQYFIWYLSLVPLLVPGFAHLTLKQILSPLVAWFFGQAVWLYFAYLLEFQGTNTFYLLWMASMLFFVINVGIIKWSIVNYKRHNYFGKNGSLQYYENKQKMS